MGKDLGHCINLSDCLGDKLIGIPYKKMSVIVDGMNLGENHIDDINPNEIYSVEVLYHAFARSIYGSSITKAGALIITLKNGSEQEIDNHALTPVGLNIVIFPGFYKAATFYSPKYPHKNDSNLDTHSTIYWNPNLTTDKDGNDLIEYYNNDIKGAYRVVVEGINDDGKLGRQVYRYEVK